MVETKKITSGTKEWADSNVNIYFGCSNNCRYCYAKKMAIRFGRKTEENWKDMVLNEKALNKEYRKRKGRIMYPTSHDITLETYFNNLLILEKLLKAGNQVLITTKPKVTCVQVICFKFEEYKDQIQFRFTITSNDDTKLEFWEPNAPNFVERYTSLGVARYFGYKTSVSIEPFLDKDPIPLIKCVAPNVSESIWFGKMNYIAKDISDDHKKYYDYQRQICSWSNIQKILRDIEKLPEDIKSKIRLKDSIRNTIEKNRLEAKTSFLNQTTLFSPKRAHRSNGGSSTNPPVDRKLQKGGKVN